METSCGSEIDPLERIAIWEFGGEIIHPGEISAIALIEGGKYLTIAGDEGAYVQVLQLVEPGIYEVCGKIDLEKELDDPKDEIDIEGLAFSGERLYVMGSHSMKRKKVDRELSQEDNWDALRKHDPQKSRQGLFEIDYLGSGKFADKPRDRCDLIPRLESDPILGPFLEIPSKENGIDMEGLAADGDDLMVGFRGPVLRQGLVPILSLDFDKPDKGELLLVDLGGRGIRDLVKTAAGYLILAGPMRKEPLSFVVYFWNGKDATPGHDLPIENVPRPLGEVSLPVEGAKAEGLGLILETDELFEIVIVYDSAPNGSPTLFRCLKPQT